MTRVAAPLFVVAALLAAGTWLLVASRNGWPVSTTHSIVGAIVGFAAVGMDLSAVLLAAARLCLRNELWGKARSYLETVISLRPTPEAYREYGALLTRLGESDAAAEAYRDGLGMVAGHGVPAIPHLDND